MVKSRENRVPMMLSNEELEAIDTWRFANRVATRSEAIRRLCQMGLQLDVKVAKLGRARTLGFYALQRMRTFLGIPEKKGPVDRETETTLDVDLYTIQAQGTMVSGSLAELGINEDPLPSDVQECFYEILAVFREYDDEVVELLGASYYGTKEGSVEQVLKDIKENSDSYTQIREARKNDRPLKGLGGKVLFP